MQFRIYIVIYIHIAKTTSHDCDIKISDAMSFSILLPVKHSYVNGSCFVHLPFQCLYTSKGHQHHFVTLWVCIINNHHTPLLGMSVQVFELFINS